MGRVPPYTTSLLTMAIGKLRAGGEVLSYCTKCRRDLNHRIIAMVAGVPVKVECESCGSHHKYRRATEDRAPDKRANAKTSDKQSTKSTTPRTAGARAAAEAAEEMSREKSWQDRIAGRSNSEFTKYSPKGNFDLDMLVTHFKFGDGFVVRVIDAGKIEVMFRDGPRVLAQGI